ncbi:Gfo/Idh/MocA family protein [Parapedobacter pyrenivorans]|uniref:Gfo/Idh/MocA family protein n=1 Tax=Parapedobacter pyrenivorans TaxID=1305674 RepID=UPI00333F3C2B
MEQTSAIKRRTFLRATSVLAGGALINPFLYAQKLSPQGGKQWKVAIVKDKSKDMLGLHGMHVAFRGIPDVEVVGLVDGSTDNINEKLAETEARRHYLTCEALLENEKPDIVVLTSRLPADHLEQIRFFAAHGCHIYCEKPLTAFLHEADEIVRLVEKNNIKIAMAHPCRNGLGFITMKRLIASGKIGVPLTVQGWGKSDHRGGGEDMMTLGTHIFDLMIYLFGRPELVSADVRIDGAPFTGPELTKTIEPIGPAAGNELFATFRFPGAVRGIFESRSHLYKQDNRMGICVTGSKGMLSHRFSDSHREPQPLRFSNAPCAPADESIARIIELREDREIPGAQSLDYSLLGTPDVPRGPIFIEAGRYAVWDLMQAILENRQPIANVYDARAALEMIYGVYASHLEQRPVSFPLKDRRHPLEKFT